MDVRPLTTALGAEIVDVDIRTDADFDAIKQAFIEHGVIILRDQNITPDEHLVFAERFGPINVNRFFKPLESHPAIATLLKEPDQKAAVGEQWHTDHSYDTVPALGSVLHAIELPPFGGDTLFVSMAAAYEALTPSFRSLLDGLYAIHSSRHAFGATTKQDEAAKTGRLGNQDLATQDSRHPIVITHPLSGRKGLYVNPGFTLHIEGMSESESAAILGFLYEHCQTPEFQCRIRWNEGDVTMWDNRATWHKALNDYHGHRRYMHRVTIEGCELSAA